jgi:hypothetical protein
MYPITTYATPGAIVNAKNGGFAFVANGLQSSLYEVDSLGNVSWTYDLADMFATNLCSIVNGGYVVVGSTPSSEGTSMDKKHIGRFVIVGKTGSLLYDSN